MNQELSTKLKENLESIEGISNVILYPGNFRGANQRNPSFEFKIPSGEESEKRAYRLYRILLNRVKYNFPNISVDYSTPDVFEHNGRRRVILYVNEELKPSEKEEELEKIVLEFNKIIKEDLFKK